VRDSPQPGRRTYSSGLLGARSVAELAGVDAKTVTRWADAGVLPYELTAGGGARRYDEAVVRELLATGQVPARPPRLLRPTEVAELARVSTKAINRWADDGLLPCTWTEGGHRRYHPDDVGKLLRRMGLPEQSAGNTNGGRP
jgi:DNA-binding transcriptional MerR regulator